jgi:methyltransferase (TIGR00027 family)
MTTDRPSDTATLIARSLLLAAHDPGLSPLLATGEAEIAERFLGERARSGWFGFARRHRWTRGGLLAAERVLLRGIFAHYLARKRWIEREVRSGITSGIRRVVVLGAGYDTLAWRLSREHPDVEFIEIDHPATQRSKRGLTESPPNLRLLPADLALEAPDEVAGTATPAIVVAEGLTMYLEPPRVASLLRSCAAVAGKHGRVVFTFMQQTEDGSIGFRGESAWIGRWLRWRKEPFRWGCRRTDLPGFLKSCGLGMQAFADHPVLRDEILSPRGLGGLPLARGECLCLCHPLSS